MSIVNGNTACFKILILGDTGVGKTCLINRFCDNSFAENYVSTVGIDYKSRCVEMESKKVLLRLWDTAGQERFRTLTSAYYRGAHGILLMFDITCTASFEHLSYWLKNIKDMANSQVCILLVGNKTDLEEQRKIKLDFAHKLADHFKVKYMEVSCKEGTNVLETFELLSELLCQNYDLQLSNAKVLSSVNLNSSDDALDLSVSSDKKSKSGKCMC